MQLQRPDGIEKAELVRLVKQLGGTNPSETIDRVFNAISDLFKIAPFPEQIHKAGRITGSYWTVGIALSVLLKEGDSLLDVGSGAGGKPSMAQLLGLSATGADDFGDHWHQEEELRQKIKDFAAASGYRSIDLQTTAELPAGPGEGYHLVMSNDVLEHQPDSPKPMLENMIRLLRPGGFLLVTVPNIANLRKRVAIVRGKTNMPPFAEYYENEGKWRGHIREYSRGDIENLSPFLGLEPVLITERDHMLHVLSDRLVPLYLIATKFVRAKDSWLLVAKKPGISST